MRAEEKLVMSKMRMVPEGGEGGSEMERVMLRLRGKQASTAWERNGQRRKRV
jgi:hypothetical protein